MLLSNPDLLQIDEDYLHFLSPEQLQSLSEKLLADLKEGRDRLNQNPSNSSRPPSTRARWDRAENGIDNEFASEIVADEESQNRRDEEQDVTSVVEPNPSLAFWPLDSAETPYIPALSEGLPKPDQSLSGRRL